jgi:hypothetical protein
VARHRQQALDTHDDEATVRHADAMTVRIARRLRLDDQYALLARLARPEEATPARLALADDARRAIAVVRGEPPQYAGEDVTGRPAGWHAWWQCQPVPVGPVPPVLWDPAATDTTLAADIELDLQEFGRVSQTRQEQLRAQPGLASWLARPHQAPPARTAEPYRQVRAQLRRSALSATGNRFFLPDSETPPAPRQVPSRLLAEVAFDEAELLALRFPAAAAELFRRAADSYAQAGDETNQVLAELALVTTVLAAQKPGEPPDAKALSRFYGALPPAAEIPFSPAADALAPGPWRYWARRLAQVPAPAQTPPSGAKRPVVRRASPFAEFWQALGEQFREAAESLAEEVGEWAQDVADKLRVLKTAGPTLLAGVGLGLAEAAAIALWTLIAHLPGFGPLIVAGAAAALTAVGGAAARRWRHGSLRRLARSAAVGAAFPPSSLEFSVLVLPGVHRDEPQVSLWTHLRWPWTAPPRQRLAIAGTALATLAAEARISVGRGRSDGGGYHGSLAQGTTGGQSVRWALNNPEADAGWWSGPAAAGLIVSPPSEAAWPWERILTASLGPPAAGQVEWRRQVYVRTDQEQMFGLNRSGAVSYAAHQGQEVSLYASAAWTPVYADHYGPPAAPASESPASQAEAGQVRAQVRHAIGAAVTTVAGPRIQVDAQPGDDGTRLLGAEELRFGDPSLIIIQAEPGSTLADSPQAADELTVQLQLAVDLIMSAAAPAVLLLPALRPEHIAPTAGAIARYAAAAGRAAPAARPDPRKLQAELRALLRPDVPPALLDDIVLFTNDRG